MTIENLSQAKVFGGWHKQYQHSSNVLNCSMRFAIYLPPEASADNPVPVLYWLSGLTCTDENFMQKAGAFRAAAKLGIAIVAPDTSLVEKGYLTIQKVPTILDSVLAFMSMLLKRHGVSITRCTATSSKNCLC
ncbi:S-formylglutathione hydrolase [Vibrio maritimus]|uniref:S-formylglutathione hydrolase YeiG n=1 Tax=Vibrio maritimus TaxID=990268 RepID=A0A090TZ45_9VIBR|nr:S-formylglutathione hydrolase [Vibrio maritimus]